MPDCVLLLAYAGANTMAFRVTLRDNALFTETPDATGAWVPGTLTDAQRMSIDRICFYEAGEFLLEGTGKPFWMLPVIWGRKNERLSCDDNGTLKAVLHLECAVRCWLSGADTGGVVLNPDQALKVQLAIACNSGNPQVTMLALPEISRNNSAAIPFGFGSDGFTQVSSTAVVNPKYYEMPSCGQAIGVRGSLANDDDYALDYGWSFALLKFAGSAAASSGSLISLVIAKEIVVDTGTFVKTYFSCNGLADIDLGADLLSKVNGASANRYTKRFMKLEQWQGCGYDAYSFASAKTFLWQVRFHLLPAFSDALLSRFNETAVQPFLDALQVTSPGNSASILPVFGNGSAASWVATYIVNDPTHGLVVKNVSYVPYGTTPVPAQVWIRAKEITPDTPSPTACSMELQGVTTTTGDTLKTWVKIQPLSENAQPQMGDLDAVQQSLEPAWRFQAVPQMAIADTTLRVLKMGALDVSFAGGNAPDTATLPPPILTDAATRTVIKASILPPVNLGGPNPCTQRDISLALPILTLTPGGQDDVPGEDPLSDVGADVFDTPDYLANFKRDSALVFMAPSAPVAATKIAFAVVFREKTNPGESRAVQATLSVIDANAAAGSTQAYVLDTEPFLFARVKATGWGANVADGASSEIGHWSSSTASDGWQLSASGTGFDLVLPPQGVGETMHRRESDGDLVPRTPAAFRFTPPATITLQASYFAQRFADAPWNLRRILGYPGQRAPGAAMNSAHFELLYGMDTTISKPNARLAEIASLMGATAGAQPVAPSWNASQDQQRLFATARGQWSALQPSLRSRLAVLQPWREGQSGTPVFDDVNNGVAVTLRDSAALRPPVPDLAQFFTDDGLAGGWSWGFESKNILTAILTNTTSTAAETHGLFFSSLGGWGHQKASFDKGRSTIYCDVSMGRVESITIERLGRIEPFWNRAKHVMVYRRSVAASRQFYLEQYPFSGAPVLRKFDEYVELIEAERPFPDAQTAAGNRGFVTGCSFTGKPPRIKVDSVWGGDVGDVGWQVPLWRPDAAPSDVYPRPNVGLQFASEVAGETLKYTVSNPQIVRFFTNTEASTGANSDLWPAVEGVSFARFDPAAMDGQAKKWDPTAGEDPAIQAGTQDFTYQLDASSGAANVVVDRTDASIGARIGNVTVMRGFVQGAGTAHASAALPTSLANAFAGPAWTVTLSAEQGTALPAAAPGAAVDASAAGPSVTLPDPLNDLSTKLNDLAKAAPGALAGLPALDAKTLLPLLGKQLISDFAGFAALLQSDAQGAFSAFFNRVVQNAKKLRMTGPRTDPNTPVELDFSVAKPLLLDLVQNAWYDDAGTVSLLLRLRGMPGNGLDGLERAIGGVEAAASTAWLAIEATRADVATLVTQGTTGFQLPVATRAAFEAELDALRSTLDEQVRQVEFALGEPVRPWIIGSMDNVLRGLGLDTIIADGTHVPRTDGAAPGPFGTIYSLDRMRRIPSDLLQLRQVYAGTLREEIDAQLAAAQESFALFAAQALGSLRDESDSSLWAALQGLADASATVVAFEQACGPLRDAIATTINGATDWDALLNMFNGADMKTSLGNYIAKVPDVLASIGTVTALGAYAQKLFAALQGFLFAGFGDLVSDLGRWIAQATQMLELLAGFPSAVLLNELRLMEAKLSTALTGLLKQVQLALPPVALPAVSADGILRLLRAFGEPPRLPDLTFTLPSVDLSELNGVLPPIPRCGYYFFDLSKFPVALPQVNLSSLQSMASQLLNSARLVDPLRIHLPVTQLLDRLIPPDLANFDLSSVFHNFGGLELTHLFPGLKLPAISNNNVRVNHGVEPSTRTAWMEADCNVPFGDQPLTVFSLAGITLQLSNATFQGSSRMQDQLGQAPQQTTTGSITGDWSLSVGGFPIVVLESCGLVYTDGGKFQFKVTPDKVKPQAALAFLADLIKSLLPDDAGFSTTITGLAATTTLELPLPDVQAGAFGISNLNLGFQFGILFGGGGGLALTTGFHIGRQTAPFTLTIFILGGAGYFETNLTYVPKTGVFTATVQVGIFVSASLAVSLGPISGGVYAYFGVTASFATSTGQASRLSIAIVILFRGEVSLLGFLSVSLCLELEATYQSGGHLSGRGTVSFDIKIGWFIHIHVSSSVTYGFQENSSHAQMESKSSAAMDYHALAQQHEAIFA